MRAKTLAVVLLAATLATGCSPSSSLIGPSSATDEFTASSADSTVSATERGTHLGGSGN